MLINQCWSLTLDSCACLIPVSRAHTWLPQNMTLISPIEHHTFCEAWLWEYRVMLLVLFSWNLGYNKNMLICFYSKTRQISLKQHHIWGNMNTIPNLKHGVGSIMLTNLQNSRQLKVKQYFTSITITIQTTDSKNKECFQKKKMNVFRWETECCITSEWCFNNLLDTSVYTYVTGLFFPHKYFLNALSCRFFFHHKHLQF